VRNNLLTVRAGYKTGNWQNEYHKSSVIKPSQKHHFFESPSMASQVLCAAGIGEKQFSTLRNLQKNRAGGSEKGGGKNEKTGGGKDKEWKCPKCGKPCNSVDMFVSMFYLWILILASNWLLSW
jgi:hypothetical protein